MKSKISKDKVCLLTGGTDNLERHHMLFGTANRNKCEVDGLWCWLTHTKHQEIHNQDVESKRYLQELAQKTYEKEIGTREQFIKRYGKSYL